MGRMMSGDRGLERGSKYIDHQSFSVIMAVTSLTFKERIRNVETESKRNRLQEKLRAHLQSHVGTSTYRRRGRLYYTDGVYVLAEEAEAHWLVRVLMSYVQEVLGQMQKTGLGRHTALLEVTDQEGTFRLYDRWLPDPEVVYGGSPDVKPYQTQHIPYTDFPLPEMKIALGPKTSGPVVESIEEVEGIIASLPTED